MKHFDIDCFFTDQLERWPLARRNFDALKDVEIKRLPFYDETFCVMYNPAREVSSGAKVDPKSIAERPCFLCAMNRPPEQIAYPILPGYSLLVNPFPIFDRHFTIASDRHQPQSILTSEPDGTSRLHTMYHLAQRLPRFIVFYNGPKCGASAPDHLHFQAVPSNMLETITEGRPLPYERFVVEADTPDRFAAEMLIHIKNLTMRPENAGLDEPRVNIYVHATGNRTVRGVIIPRRAHRPSCYGSGEGEMLVSPGAIDVAGTLVCCRKMDFEHLDLPTLRVILQETTYCI